MRTNDTLPIATLLRRSGHGKRLHGRNCEGLLQACSMAVPRYTRWHRSGFSFSISKRCHNYLQQKLDDQTRVSAARRGPRGSRHHHREQRSIWKPVCTEVLINTASLCSAPRETAFDPHFEGSVALSPFALLRLLQLASPARLTGPFPFSCGLETVIATEHVYNEDTALEWIAGLAWCAIGSIDVPILQRMQAAWMRGDREAVLRWGRRLLLSRETDRLRAEDRTLGQALARTLSESGIGDAGPFCGSEDASYTALFALATARWQIPADAAACGYLWAWAESQVLAAVRLVPLCRTASQQLLDDLGRQIPAIVASAKALRDEQIGFCGLRRGDLPVQNETKYTRLFRG
jgi:urease accessory protein